MCQILFGAVNTMAVALRLPEYCFPILVFVAQRFLFLEVIHRLILHYDYLIERLNHLYCFVIGVHRL